MIGNKCDIKEDREVSEEHIKNFMKEFKIDKYYETSALKGINTETPFL